MPDLPPLLRVCRFLNEAGARYLIAGAQACILHGLVRTTVNVKVGAVYAGRRELVDLGDEK